MSLARRRSAGFTLLEVMVAMAILGLGLTAILSAQGSALASSASARNISVATGLARCKMNEVEEGLMVLGYPAADQTDSGVCCEGDESPFTCTWSVELPVLPEPKFGELDLDSELGDAGGLGALSSMPSLAPTAGATPGAGLGDIAQGLSGITGGADGAGGLAGITSMVMGMVYPQLKGIMEASTRRIVVKVSWKEGVNERSLDVTQWITNPQQAGVVGDVPDGAESLLNSGSGSGPAGAISGARSPLGGRSGASPLGGSR